MINRVDTLPISVPWIHTYEGKVKGIWILQNSAVDKQAFPDSGSKKGDHLVALCFYPHALALQVRYWPILPLLIRPRHLDAHLFVTLQQSVKLAFADLQLACGRAAIASTQLQGIKHLLRILPKHHGIVTATHTG